MADPATPAERFLDVAQVLPQLRGGGWRSDARALLSWLLGLEPINHAFATATGTANPFQELMDLVGVSLDTGSLAASLPSSGPVLIISNHPFGGLDALGLTGAILQLRPDAKIIGNALAAGTSTLSPWIFPVDITGNKSAAMANGRSIRNAGQHLAQGKALIAFPAGAVSTWRHDLARVADCPWSPHIAALAQRQNSPVLPVRFDGSAPPWFHLLGSLHPFIRTALLPRVFLSQAGSTGHCTTGPLITPNQWAGLSTDQTSDLFRKAVDSIVF